MGATAKAIDETLERELTIEMWRWRGTRRYLTGLPLDGGSDDKWDETQTRDRGRIQLVREE